MRPQPTTAETNTAQVAGTTIGPEITHSDESAFHFHLRTRPFQIDRSGNIQVDGLNQIVLDPGAPAIPYFSTLIALPPQAQVSITISESGQFQLQAGQVAPAAREQLAAQPDPLDIFAADPATIMEPQALITPDTTIYALDAPFPNYHYELSEPRYIRDLRVVELKLFPLQYNPVRQTVNQVTDLFVQLSFSGAVFKDLHPAPGFVDNQSQAYRDMILNFDQAGGWRSLPLAAAEQTTADLPIGVNTYKILVDQDGIYEISGAELAVQGMSLPVDPATIAMMHDGQPVAYQFIDVNGGGQFDSGDKIRFYGWAFDGSRYEQMYVNDNVFWLWAGGSADPVPVVANEAGTGTVVTNFKESVTRQDENDNFSAWAEIWENDPTVWHWDLLTAPAGQTTSKSYNLDLPDPDSGAAGNSVLVEFTTKLDPFTVHPPTYTAKTFLNGSSAFGEHSWLGRNNFNLVKEFPTADFKQPGDAGYPANQVQVNLSSNLSSGSATVQLTSITIAYTRLLKALGDQLIFSSNQVGQLDFQVSGFNNGDPAAAVVWDISDPHQPVQIAIQSAQLTGSGSNHTVTIGRNLTGVGRFIATTTANSLSVKDIALYVPVSLTPPSGEAEWLAITHSSLRSAADTLAAHRAADFSTFVVDMEDITNQVGYGFNTPNTIRTFLSNAILNWSVGPHYVALFGDATRNPLQQDCPLCTAWDKNAPTLIVTDFAFVDRWNGMVPSDFTMSLLFGDDLYADVSIGRFPANTPTEANIMVQKVILFENQRLGKLEAWQKHFLFVADNTDLAGNFCVENQQTGTRIPSLPFSQTHLCLPAATTQDTANLLQSMGEQVNNVGATVLNYRGHGSTTAWASGPVLLTAANTAFWQNIGRPLFILSADCLDGYFISTHNSALGETFFRLDNRGSAAHWSSSGFGFSTEHTALHNGFYEGLFDHNLTRIGDAVDYSKVQYATSGRYYSELLSFILLGDPAMFLFKTIPEAQTIDLHAGWNMISGWIDPDAAAMKDLFTDPGLEICKDGNGDLYWPFIDFNTIGDWQVGDGYQCYANSPLSVLLTGRKIIPEETALNLPQGWSLIAYMRKTPMDPTPALDTISSKIVIVKNNDGDIYWPEFEINQFGNMQPGQGYQIYLSGSGTLLYPANNP